MNYIPPSNQTLYETFCEQLCDQIERLYKLPKTNENKAWIANREFLLNRFTWMIQSDMGVKGNPHKTALDMLYLDNPETTEKLDKIGFSS